ncbi:MAG: LptF/LptG family permease [Spirochaetaceae bacterium]|jgi:lipopolysaccharide export system permease protein|nr:LptF/LptG family permease [Spirochaetaceae bacterium]
MTTLDRYLLKQFFPIFAAGAIMFMLFISLIDLFANLWRYLNYEVPARQILLVCAYYLPKSFSYALPVALLFAAAYTLGDLYSRNELSAIFASGIPFYRFSMPLVIIGLLSSVCSFFFEDNVVVPTFKLKNDLGSALLHQPRGARDSYIVIKSKNGRRVYSIDYYDHRALILNGVIILEVPENSGPLSVVRAPKAAWNGEHWEFTNGVLYDWEGDLMRIKPLESGADYTEHPDAFRRSAVNVEDLSAREAAFMVDDLKIAGLPFTNALADYYHRYSFSAVCFVVMILSISMGGRFRKNILLMSFASSLGSAVVFYVTEMITMMMARMDYIPPLIGAWFPVALFVLIGAALLKTAKT